MSFQSKRLRVQLPCNEGTLVEQAMDCPMGTRCNGASFFCDPNTCVFGEHSRVGPEGLCNIGTCNFVSPFPCGGFGTDPRADPRSIVVDPEQLPLIRQALEAQLKEIETAEQALKDRGSSQ
jgi:hypothetical protein